MTIFASTPPYNTDPFPKLANGVRVAADLGNYMDAWGTAEVHDAPRPEFDAPRAHEANPILTAFREQPQGIGMARYWAESLAHGWRLPGQYWTGPQRDHARKVLTRLATFEGSK